MKKQFDDENISRKYTETEHKKKIKLNYNDIGTIKGNQRYENNAASTANSKKHRRGIRNSSFMEIIKSPASKYKTNLQNTLKKPNPQFQINESFLRVSRFSIKSKNLQQQSDDINCLDDELKNGAIELFNNIFEQKLEDGIKYSKHQLLKAAVVESMHDEREKLIKELIENIFGCDQKEQMDIEEILEEIINQIQHDKYFRKESQYQQYNSSSS